MRAALALIGLVLVACGPEESTPQVSEGPQFSSGEAHVDLTGDLEATLDLTLAEDRDPSYEDGTVSLEWEDADGNFMRMNATPKSGEADARSDETPLLVSFLVNDRSFSSEATRTCAVTFDRLESEAIRGALTCSDLLLPGAGGIKKVSAEGTFSAAA